MSTAHTVTLNVTRTPSYAMVLMRRGAPLVIEPVFGDHEYGEPTPGSTIYTAACASGLGTRDVADWCDGTRKDETLSVGDATLMRVDCAGFAYPEDLVRHVCVTLGVPETASA